MEECGLGTADAMNIKRVQEKYHRLTGCSPVFDIVSGMKRAKLLLAVLAIFLLPSNRASAASITFNDYGPNPFVTVTGSDAERVIYAGTGCVGRVCTVSLQRPAGARPFELGGGPYTQGFYGEGILYFSAVPGFGGGTLFPDQIQILRGNDGIFNVQFTPGIDNPPTPFFAATSPNAFPQNVAIEWTLNGTAPGTRTLFIDTFNFLTAPPVPEPGSIAMAAAGLACIAWLRRRRIP